MEYKDIVKLLEKGMASLPEPELKYEWERVFKRMVVHSRGVPPCDLLDKTFPHEEEEVRKYRLDNYEPITTGEFDKGFDNLYRALSESNWSLNAPDELKAYLKTLNVNGIPFWQYMFKPMLRRKIEDPNGWLVVLPYGEGLTVKTKKVDIRLEIVLCTQISYMTPEVVIYKSCEKSTLKDNKGNDYEGDVYYIITKKAYFQYKEINSPSGKKWEVSEYYKHNIGEIPFNKLGGRPTGKLDSATGKEEYYSNSDFNSYVAFANEALRDNSMHQGVKVTSAFPIRVMDAIPCDNKPACNGGLIYYENGDKPSKCPRCRGTGDLIPTGVHRGIILRKKGGKPQMAGDDTGAKPIEFFYPSVDILKLMGESSDSNLKKASMALQTSFMNTAQSGVAKELDREDQYSMLYSFSDYFFEINIKKPIWFIYKLLNPNGKDEINIVKPINFQIKNEQVLLKEFTDALIADVPYGILISLYCDWIKKRFSGDALRLKIEEVSLMYDPFYLYPIARKNELVMTNAMTTNDLIRSARVSTAIWSIYMKNKETFFEITDEQFVTKLNEIIDPFLQTEEPPALPV